MLEMVPCSFNCEVPSPDTTVTPLPDRLVASSASALLSIVNVTWTSVAPASVSWKLMRLIGVTSPEVLDAQYWMPPSGVSMPGAAPITGVT